MITFSPKTVTKELLVELPDRSRKVLVDRFGLSQSNKSRTLDAIGQEYGITRERVRQIENHALALVRESEAYDRHEPAMEELSGAIAALGGVLTEDMLLNELATSASERTHIIFLLAVSPHFNDRNENSDFRARWHVDELLAEQIEEALRNLHAAIEPARPIPEEEFIQLFAKQLKSAGVKVRYEEALPRWLFISKRIGKNPLGEWGRADSPHIRVKNTRDFAYLTLKRNGSPMHFTEVAKNIGKLFKRDTHPATTHNELIKDKRFVLVGRGLYALKEWGYEPGVVRDVIAIILKREGPLTREEIIERVKRERYVKDATIGVNLQAPFFARAKNGRYTLAK